MHYFLRYLSISMRRTLSFRRVFADGTVTNIHLSEHQPKIRPMHFFPCRLHLSDGLTRHCKACRSLRQSLAMSAQICAHILSTILPQRVTRDLSISLHPSSIWILSLWHNQPTTNENLSPNAFAISMNVESCMSVCPCSSEEMYSRFLPMRSPNCC